MEKIDQLIMVKSNRVTQSRRKLRLSSEEKRKAQREVDEASQSIQEFRREIENLELKLLARVMNKKITMEDFREIEAKLRTAQEEAIKRVLSFEKAKKRLSERLHSQEVNQGLYLRAIASQKASAIFKEKTQDINFRRINYAEENELEDILQYNPGATGI
ncbi:hypothetical protein ABLN87_21445 [Ruegeria sp. SCPT10]|uniref:hypothetical protein n=1 Tax=Ruegeria sp. SCP10 TaxID=3141377 RepID=UPI003338F152